MNILSLYGKEIFSLVVPLFTWLLNNYFKVKAKVCYGGLHQFTFLIEEPLYDSDGNVIRTKQTVHTHSYVFSNEGKVNASSLEVIFNYKPMYLNVWPSRAYDVKLDGNGRFIMIFDYISPKEIIRCEVMSINLDLPELLSVRCKEGLGREINFYPQKIMNPYFINFVRLLLFLGSAALVYICIVLLQWLLLKTG